MSGIVEGFKAVARRGALVVLVTLMIVLPVGLYNSLTSPDRPGDLTLVDPGEPTLSVWLDGKVSTGGGKLVVQLSVPEGSEVSLPEPEIEGLDFREDGLARVERLGERSVITRRYKFSGNRNSYELPSLQATWGDGDAEQAVASDPMWIDLGVEGPEVGEIADIRDPSEVRAAPWGMLAAIFGMIILFAGGLVVGLKPAAPTERPVFRPRPDKKALDEWKVVRASSVMPDYDKAVALSAIFREYVEAVLGFPAQKWTTTQSVEHLRSMPHLPEGNVPRAKRLLRATDLVKFAERDIDDSFFDSLDDDLRGFIKDTRPVRWDPVKGAAA